eukprot:scaffold742_cov395-Prasinococcus_capsulatus_cf.AAC.26
MEEGVVNGLLKGSLGTISRLCTSHHISGLYQLPKRELFDSRLHITEQSGSGNNWSVGHEVYGRQYHDELYEVLRCTAEECDSLQSFMLLHSLGEGQLVSLRAVPLSRPSLSPSSRFCLFLVGGGTGSGVGSYILEMMSEEFPDVHRFTTSILPSSVDDVVTSPYNTILSLATLAEHANFVLPLENQALMDLVGHVEALSKPKGGLRSTRVLTGEQTEKGENPFGSMNAIAANILLHLSSSPRFEGSLNIDLNEICMNLVPFPRLHFILPALAPSVAPTDLGKLKHLSTQPSAIDRVFDQVFAREQQVVKADPRNCTSLACGLLARGQINVADLTRNVARLRSKLKMIHWNKEAFKVRGCACCASVASKASYHPGVRSSQSGWAVFNAANGTPVLPSQLDEQLLHREQLERVPGTIPPAAQTRCVYLSRLAPFSSTIIGTWTGASLKNAMRQYKESAASIVSLTWRGLLQQSSASCLSTRSSPA